MSKLRTKETKWSKNAYEKLKENRNVSFYETQHGFKVSIAPYDVILIENPSYVKKLYNKIITAIPTILSENEIETFTFQISGFSVGGLYETNSTLINRETSICCLY